MYSRHRNANVRGYGLSTATFHPRMMTTIPRKKPFPIRQKIPFGYRQIIFQYTNHHHSSLLSDGENDIPIGDKQHSPPSESTPGARTNTFSWIDNSLQSIDSPEVLSVCQECNDDIYTDLSLDVDVVDESLGILSNPDFDFGQSPLELVVSVDVYEDSTLNLISHTTGKDEYDNITSPIDVTLSHNHINSETSNNGELMTTKSMDGRDNNNKAGCNMNGREVVCSLGCLLYTSPSPRDS